MLKETPIHHTTLLNEWTISNCPFFVGKYPDAFPSPQKQKQATLKEPINSHEWEHTRTLSGLFFPRGKKKKKGNKLNSEED